MKVYPAEDYILVTYRFPRKYISKPELSYQLYDHGDKVYFTQSQIMNSYEEDGEYYNITANADSETFDVIHAYAEFSFDITSPCSIVLKVAAEQYNAYYDELVTSAFQTYNKKIVPRGSPISIILYIEKFGNFQSSLMKLSLRGLRLETSL